MPFAGVQQNPESMFKRTDVQPYLSVTLCSNPNDQQCRMQLHPHLRAGYQSYRDRINENIRPTSCEMTGTYRGRSRHRLPRREGARIAGRTGGVPQYVPADMYRCVPTWHGIPAKAFQVSLPAAHLPRYSRESVPGSLSCRPPATVFPRKRSRCSFLPSTWHGIPAKAFQVSFSAVHLARNPRESVSGSTSYRPPGTESLRKCSRWHLSAVHLARNPRESVPGSISLPSTCHGIPAKAFQVASPCCPPVTAVPLIMGCRGFSAGQISSL